MMSHVAMHMPPTRIVCAEAQHNIAPWRNDNSVLSDCAIKFQRRPVHRAILPPSSGKACPLATLDIVSTQACGVFCTFWPTADGPCVIVERWISDLQYMKGMAV